MKLSFRKREEEMTASQMPGDHCPHTAMIPRWDSADDIGHDDRATAFRCESCGGEFSPQETQALRASEPSRLAAIQS